MCKHVWHNTALCMWQLVFSLCHHLINKIKNKKNNNKKPKGCLIVMDDPSYLDHVKQNFTEPSPKARLSRIAKL